MINMENLEKKSNLKFKLDELPRPIRDYFFQEVTTSKILDALRKVKKIDASTKVIRYAYSLPLTDILPDEEDEEKNTISFKVMDLNYYECLDLLELITSTTSEDNEVEYLFESTYSTK